MTDYIRRDDAIIKGMEIALGGLNTPLKIKALFDEIPASNIVEVVRCKDCKYCDMVDENERWCLGWGSPARLVAPDSYCSRGIRKEGQR